MCLANSERSHENKVTEQELDCKVTLTASQNLSNKLP